MKGTKPKAKDKGREKGRATERVLGPYSDCLFRCVDPDAIHAAYANRKLPPRDGKAAASPPASQEPPRPVRPRCCKHCLHANRVRDGRRMLWICANTPQSPGAIVRVPPDNVCPNYRAQRGGPIEVSPPGPVEEGARLIALTRGLFAVVDAEDYDRLNRYKWSAMVGRHTYYAVRNDRHRLVLMHREIMSAPPGMVVDHINRNGLYNRRRNLRICTHAQNCCNRVLYKPHNSRFQGVHRGWRPGKWIGQAYLKGHRFHCGTFDNEEEAARARDYKTVQLHGPYAYLNFPDEWPFARRQAVYDEYQAQAA